MPDRTTTTTARGDGRDGERAARSRRPRAGHYNRPRLNCTARRCRATPARHPSPPGTATWAHEAMARRLLRRSRRADDAAHDRRGRARQRGVASGAQGTGAARGRLAGRL